MARIHITLVGGQTTPVYQGILYANPDKVVYIYSEGSKENAELIKSEVKIDAEMRKMDPVDLQDIEKKVHKCFDSYKEDELTINISSGTKPWAYYFINIFSSHSNAKLFYIDQNGKLWNFDDRSFTDIPFDMDAQFRLKGNTLKNFKNFSDYMPEDMRVLWLIEELRTFSPSDFNILTNNFDKHNNIVRYENEKTGSVLSWDKASKSFEMTLMKKNKESLNHILKSPNVRSLLLNTGWFEYKVAELLSRWEKCKVIKMNCLFPSKANALKNEIDIIIDTGSKLLFVECKTQIFKITDIDKFNSAVKNYGGMGSKALFVTDAPMDETAREKCREYNILSFSLQDEHLEMEVGQALIMLLNSELFNINTK